MHHLCVVLVGFAVTRLARAGWVGRSLNTGFGVMATILNILSYVSVLTLVALGLAIVFGLMDIVNLAHAEWVTMGAYTLAVAQSVGG